ncbi:hypothetical protein GCM10010400_46070 [Streptomyces aculeolatus]|uniref:hypothetical protein n=1 Tax=Streptomyces aculeolatus TaxID=270689 RepID=UPI001CEC5319|nr:hypothetical protein [Streptomyces aculeolatus]
MRRLRSVISATAAAVALAGTVLTGASPAQADVGDVTYADMLGGRVTFVQTDASTVRMNGQFNDGFYDPHARCLIYVGQLPPPDHLDARITPPGTTPFEYDYQDVTIDDFTAVPVRVVCDDEVIGVGMTVPVE